eukprot:2987640-Pyramimonas_sp.AAC.1
MRAESWSGRQACTHTHTREPSRSRTTAGGPSPYSSWGHRGDTPATARLARPSGKRQKTGSFSASRVP